MRSELAEELLHRLMDWDRAAFHEKVRQLEALATCKFDEYGNFRPGVKFFESLAAWLDQLDGPIERSVALNFVLERLVFISDGEMVHLIELVYPSHIEPVLRRRTATLLGCSPYAVARIVRDPAFVALRRRSLVLGASDGARLDRLRRSAPFLSHEQFLQSAEPASELMQGMTRALAEALDQLENEGPAKFEHVFFVDDFAGSGKTMLRREDDVWKGKLVKLDGALSRLKEAGLISDDVEVSVVLYVASAQACEHLATAIPASPVPHWELRVVQELPTSLPVDNRDKFAALCECYYDEWFTDDYKGRAALGYAGCALPVVLSHNTPNNSMSLLWADSTEEPDSLRRRALFPRYERHHRDRP